ncbi:hypothetical protein [Neisseria bacilliformis]|uniref:hypothetical protein n=1 Tax=Neisseria bacilliformis TaxID=267212 RepID=UPI0012B669D0|nr:hypothetical protein [Neisseria bacilliformis]QMT48671.1 hypothetical protein H3L91_06220 [Neisseria bacilliformis]
MPDKSRQQKTSGMNARPAALTAVIPAQAGILAEFGQQFVFFFTYCRAPNKIPACAGMTA